MQRQALVNSLNKTVLCKPAHPIQPNNAPPGLQRPVSSLTCSRTTSGPERRALGAPLPSLPRQFGRSPPGQVVKRSAILPDTCRQLMPFRAKFPHHSSSSGGASNALRRGGWRLFRGRSALCYIGVLGPRLSRLDLTLETNVSKSDLVKDHGSRGTQPSDSYLEGVASGAGQGCSGTCTAGRNWVPRTQRCRLYKQRRWRSDPERD